MRACLVLNVEAVIVTNVLHTPQVMQLEVVRPDESSNQDQLQEAAVGTSVIVIIVICSIVGVTIIVVLFFFVSMSQLV